MEGGRVVMVTGGGVVGVMHVLLGTFQFGAMCSQDSIWPEGDLQSFIRLLSQVPGKRLGNYIVGSDDLLTIIIQQSVCLF